MLTGVGKRFFLAAVLFIFLLGMFPAVEPTRPSKLCGAIARQHPSPRKRTRGSIESQKVRHFGILHRIALNPNLSSPERAPAPLFVLLPSCSRSYSFQRNRPYSSPWSSRRMTAQFLQNELSNLIQEAKRKNSDLRHVRNPRVVDGANVRMLLVLM
jgi:hypothetical protein